MIFTSFFINREEAIVVSRSIKHYIRVLEKVLVESRKEGDEKKEALTRKRIRQCTKIIKKAGKYIEDSSKLSLIVSEEFRA